MPFILSYFICFAYFTLLSFLGRCFFLFYFQPQFATLSITQKIYALWWGITFDIAGAGTITGIITLAFYIGVRLTNWHRFLKYLLILPVAFAVITVSADVMYYADAGRHITYEIRDFFQDFGGLITTAFTQYLWMALIALTIVTFASMGLVYLHSRFVDFHQVKHKAPHFELLVLFLLLISFLCARGGFRYTHLHPYNSFDIANPKQAAISFSSIYSGVFHIMTSRKPLHEIPLPQLPNDQKNQALLALYPHHAKQADLNHLRKMNVIVIMLESWPAMLLKSYGYDKDVAPQFDALRQRTFTTAGMIANGHRTSEGVFATFCSYQNPLGQSVAQSQLEYNEYNCLPTILRAHGWTTAFSEGTSKDTTGVGSLTQKLGFEFSWGREDIHQHKYPLATWGYHDPDQYAFVLQKIRELPQPFLLGINTTTTHEGNNIPKQTNPVFGDNEVQLNTLHFSDAALIQFLQDYAKLKNKLPTLFIIEADHTAGLKIASTAQQYFIPFLMFATDNSTNKQKAPYLASQRDIAPTIMTALNGYVPWFTGKPIQNRHHQPYFADYFDNNVLGWITDDRLIEINLSNQQLTCYRWQNNMDLKKTIACDSQDKEHFLQALAFTDRSQKLLFAGKTEKFFN